MKKYHKYIFILCLFSLCYCISSQAAAQELNATVSVRHQKINGIDPSIFNKMTSEIKDFLNSRAWTSTHYKTNERIDCRFLIDLQKEDHHVYKAILTVQSSRPVYNSTYRSPLFNYKDNNFTFKFESYTPLVFNKNRITGSDPLASNLTATLAYYAYIIIGLDEDSFSLNGGHDAFEMAQNIVNDAPDGRQISGWKSFEGTTNRYWLAENLLNVRYKSFHKVLYNYHRKGLDKMYDHPGEGREEITKTLNTLHSINADNPRLMILGVFFATKSKELANIFSKGSQQERMTALNLLNKLDPSHSSVYQKSMKK